MTRNKSIFIMIVLVFISILTYLAWGNKLTPTFREDKVNITNNAAPLFSSSFTSINSNAPISNPLDATRARQERLRKASNFWDYTDIKKHKPVDGEIIYWDRVAAFCFFLSGTSANSSLIKMQTDSRVAAAYTEFSKLCANKSKKEWANRFVEIQKMLPKDRLFQLRMNIYGLDNPTSTYQVSPLSRNELKQGMTEILASQDSKIIFNPGGGILLPVLVNVQFFDGKPLDEEFVVSLSLAALELECEYGEACNSSDDLRLIEACMNGDCFNSRHEYADSLINSYNDEKVNRGQVEQAKNTLRQFIASKNPMPWFIPDAFNARRAEIQKNYEAEIARLQEQAIKDLTEDASKYTKATK